jgi:signal transduction histidine kinase
MEAMPGGGVLTMAARLDRHRQKAQLEIADTGYGIAEEHLPHIFDPFFTTKTEGQGTGLGLSIAYGVVKVHRGDIRVESRVGEGSRFFLTFPLCEDQPGPEQETDEQKTEHHDRR